jgi:(p)ppGpp synthase/HD superfamily hydrolase
MSDLTRAIVIAAEAHKGDVDKAGEMYLLHPLRVMMRMATEEERITAVLHDLLEDTDWEPEDLRREGFSEEVIQALDHLTRREGEVYHLYVKRAARNPLARVVKRMDLEDNMDLSRIAHPTEKDLARVEKYRQALGILEKASDP